MSSLFDILLLLISVARFFVIAHFILSWLISFNVLNTGNQFVSQVWYGLNRILEPIYGPIRRRLPDFGGIDFTPLIVLIGLEIIRIVLINNYAFFH